MKIEGSVALVTGANRGIGKAFADELLARGATKVYAAVRDVTTVTDPRLTPVALDVTDPAAVAEAAAEFTDVTIVVNNAGIASSNLALSAPLDVARGELEVNYFGLMAMTQAFAPVMAAGGGGAFVNMLSVASWVAYPVTATYGASKAAAWSYTNAARQQLKAQGTEVVAVHVGPVDTDMQAGFDIPKTPPADVARTALDALEAGRPEAVVDEVSSSVKAALHDDQTLLYPAIEAQFAAQLAG
ncbi:SDR family oxidoreductase [Streptomyces niveiscabiei]|uniref:SDR family oxidoreductase n=1 Tax=Streptomyces niveiscabiei TaxID=164115 RepID=UPI0029A4A24C|nr:SDR family oxidoreductase [Streptomyces niveiscabiei]MDX3386088.1 SDR family oxidoreductase [Streptomyces niveiscabiei]